MLAVFYAVALSIGIVTAQGDLPMSEEVGPAVVGRVLSPEGTPQADARVLLLPETRTYGEALAVLDGEKEVRSLETRTDAQGWFRLVSPEAGLWRVRVEAGGREPAEIALRPLLTDTGLPPLRLAEAVAAQPPQKAQIQRAPKRACFQLGGRPAAGAVLLAGHRLEPVEIFGPDGCLTMPGEHPVVLVAPSGAARALDPRVEDVDLPAVSELRGRVFRRPGREPVANTVVWLRGVPGFVRSGADGLFRLPAFASELGGWLEVSAHDYLPTAIPVGIKEGGERSAQRLSISLEPAAVVTGLVVDLEGRPVGGVEVNAVAASTSAAPSPGPTLPPATVTGPSGRFSLPQLPAGQPLRLEAALPGQAPTVRSLAALPSGLGNEVLRIVLSPTPAVSGVLVDSARVPVAGTALRLQWSEAASEPGAVQRPTPWAESGASGSFRIPVESSGRFRLEVHNGKGLPVTVVSEFSLPPGAGGMDLGLVELPPSAALAGQVVDHHHRRVAGAEIALRERADEPWRAVAQSSPEGNFRLTDLVADRSYDIRVSHPDFAPELVTGIAAGEAEPIEVVLGTGGTLMGRVVDDEGAGISGADVEIRSRRAGSAVGRRGEGVVRHLQTDAEGTFEADHLSAGEVVVSASADGYRSASVAGVTVTDDGTPVAEVEIELDPGASLRGTVRSADGEPVVGATVKVLAESSGALLSTVPSGRAGRFDLSGLPLGDTLVVGEHPAYRRSERALDLRSGEQSVELVLKAGAAIAGRVVGVDDAPLAGARIWVDSSAAGAEAARATSASDGRFELIGVAPGRQEVRAEKSGYAPAAAEVQVPRQSVPEPLVLRLERETRIAGSILGLEPSALAPLEVAAVSPGRAIRQGEVQGDATFTVGGLAAGIWELVGRVPGSRYQARETVEIPPDAGQVNVDLIFEPGFALTGRVLAAGDPVAGAEVTAMDPARGQAVSDATDQAGRFRLSGLAEGRLDLRVESHGDGLAHRQPVDLTGDLELTVELDAGPLIGQVVGTGGAPPVAGARVDLIPPGGTLSEARPVSTLTDSRGGFQFALLRWGSYDLVVRSAAGRRAMLQVEHQGVSGPVVVVLDSSAGDPAATDR